MDICLPVPAPGRYAVAVHHDLNTNGERDRQDGGGYSRNPKVSLFNPKPAFAKAAFRSATVRRGSASPCFTSGALAWARGQLMARPRIALISNPKSTGNLAQLPRIRAFAPSTRHLPL